MRRYQCLGIPNVSQKPIVAYVVVVESPNHRSVLHGVYTGKDALAVGQTAAVGEVAAPIDQVKGFIDYVRLADGTTWVKRRPRMRRRFPPVSNNNELSPSAPVVEISC